jgi:hypothetical protein
MGAKIVITKTEEELKQLEQNCKLFTTEQKEFLDAVISGFEQSLNTMDLVLSSMLNLRNSSEIGEEQKRRIDAAILSICDHLQSTITEIKGYIQSFNLHKENSLYE